MANIRRDDTHSSLNFQNQKNRKKVRVREGDEELEGEVNKRGSFEELKAQLILCMKRKL